MSDNSDIIANALYKTDIDLYNEIDGGNSWKQSLVTRGARVAKYRRYEDGDHDANMTTQMREMLRLKSDDSELEEMNINYMPIVIDKMASRIHVSEITAETDEENEYIAQIINNNDFLSDQEQYWRGAIRDGDSYVIVDPVTMRWISNPAYDGFSGVVAIYQQSEDFPRWACKLWAEADMDLSGQEPENTVKMKMVIYQSYRIVFAESQSESAEITITKIENWKLGVAPIIHYANSIDNYTLYGKSEIRKAIPIQDVLNRTVYSMVMASEFSAFKVAWSIGMRFDKSGITPGAVIEMVPKDENGQDATELDANGIAFLNACRVGELSSTDISQYTNQINHLVQQISHATNTPIYGVTTQGNLSGEALKQLENGLVGKIRRFQNENKAAVVLLIELTSRMQNMIKGAGPAPKLNNVSVFWASPEIIDVNSSIATLITMRRDAPGLWDDDFYRSQIGGLLQIQQSKIIEEGEKAQNVASNNFDQLTRNVNAAL